VGGSGGGGTAGAAVGGSGGGGTAGLAGSPGTALLCDGFPIPGDHPNAARDYAGMSGVVADSVTGLTWEEAASNGGFVLFEQNCSTKTTGGLSGWRLSTLLELVSIVDFGVRDPAIDLGSFPGTLSGFFSSSTPIYEHGFRSGPQGYGWSVDFKTGIWTNGTPSDAQFRCVREATQRRCYRANERFEPTSSSKVAEVRDAFSGLTWQRVPAPEKKAWNDAGSYCAGLGDGYRLPGVKELLSIVDLRNAKEVTDAAIDTAAFPGTPPDVFWSATKAAGSPSKRLGFSFQGIYPIPRRSTRPPCSTSGVFGERASLLASPAGLRRRAHFATFITFPPAQSTQ